MMGTPKRRIVVAVFGDAASAQRAVGALREAHFPPGDVGVEEGGQDVPGLASALTSMGVAEADVRGYHRAHQAGKTLLTVSTAGRHEKARTILREMGAEAVDQAPQAVDGAPQAVASTPRAAAMAESRPRPSGETGRTLELVEEELVARTRPVQTGEILIRKEVVVVNRTVEISLNREELVVERRSVERGTPPTDDQAPGAEDPFAARFHALAPGEVIRVPLIQEEAVIEKRPVVYEEVMLSKALLTEAHRVSADVRREELRVEEREPGRVRPPQA